MKRKKTLPAYKFLFNEKNLKIAPFLAFKGDLTEFSLFIVLKALQMKLSDALYKN